jgi:hypothetical protein
MRPGKKEAPLFIDEKERATLSDKSAIMVDHCLAWFIDHPNDLTVLIRILTRREEFSLRIVDWMVTNYSKYHRLTVLYRDMPLDVHDDYQRYLSVFNKKLFDPFARRQRIRLFHDEGDVSTTIGQLNFMKWFLERRLDTIVLEHRAEIEADMKNTDNNRTSNKLAPSARYHTGPFTLDF